MSPRVTKTAECLNVTVDGHVKLNLDSSSVSLECVSLQQCMDTIANLVTAVDNMRETLEAFIKTKTE